MWSCPDCRAPLAVLALCACGWAPRSCAAYDDCLSTRERENQESASYRDIYDLLAERNLIEPSLSNSYVEILARQFADTLGDLRGKDFCDVGSGRGYLIREAVKRGVTSAVPVDIAAASLVNVRETTGIRGVLANAEALPFERRFDVLSATDIVEHVLNVANFLVCANWALRDGGMLAVRVPYRENIIYYSNFFGLPMHYTHLRTFNAGSLRDLIEPFGFRVSGPFHYAGYFTQRSWETFNRVPRLRDAIRKRLTAAYGSNDVSEIDSRVGRLFMRPVEIGVVCRKVQHIVARNVHEPLQRFTRERQARTEGM